MPVTIQGTNSAATPALSGDSDSGVVCGSDQVDISTGGTSRATIDSTSAIIRGDLVRLMNSAGSEVYLEGNSNGNVELYYDNALKLATVSAGAKVTGYLHSYGDESESDFTTFDRHVFQSHNSSVPVAVFEHTNSSVVNGVVIFFSNEAPDNNTRYFLYGQDNVSAKFAVYSDGDVWTSDAGTLSSDQTLKENIVDATSKLEDIKKLKVRNFNWKSSFHPEKSKQKQIGFIAQEVEEVFPSLVSEYNIAKEGDTPVMKKAIKQAWDPIIIKALQEAIAKIEILETKVATLEAA